MDLLILWLALLALHAHPSPASAVVLMAYIIGALGGSVPPPGQHRHDRAPRLSLHSTYLRGARG
ncbi:MAG: hypothetical protein ACLP4R_24885 [Solirubrobacteraceae bacterium]